MNQNDYETGFNRDERYLLNKIRMKEIQAIEKSIQPERSKREDSHEQKFIGPRHDKAIDFDNKLMFL